MFAAAAAAVSVGCVGCALRWSPRVGVVRVQTMWCVWGAMVRRRLVFHVCCSIAFVGGFAVLDGGLVDCCVSLVGDLYQSVSSIEPIRRRSAGCTLWNWRSARLLSSFVGCFPSAVDLDVVELVDVR